MMFDREQNIWRIYVSMWLSRFWLFAAGQALNETLDLVKSASQQWSITPNTKKAVTVLCFLDVQVLSMVSIFKLEHVNSPWKCHLISSEETRGDHHTRSCCISSWGSGSFLESADVRLLMTVLQTADGLRFRWLTRFLICSPAHQASQKRLHGTAWPHVTTLHAMFETAPKWSQVL